MGMLHFEHGKIVEDAKFCQHSPVLDEEIMMLEGLRHVILLSCIYPA